MKQEFCIPVIIPHSGRMLKAAVALPKTIFNEKTQAEFQRSTRGGGSMKLVQPYPSVSKIWRYHDRNNRISLATATPASRVKQGSFNTFPHLKSW